jgi:hypothetical protein
VQAELRDVFSVTAHPGEGLGVTNGQHRVILAAVVQGDARAAHDAMVGHVQSTGEYMIRLRLEFDGTPNVGRRGDPDGTHRPDATPEQPRPR